MKQKPIIATSFVIVFLLTSCAGPTGIVPPTPAESLFPDKIINLHIEHHLKESIFFVLTDYVVPYKGTYQYIQLYRDGTFESWLDASGLAMRGIIRGQLTPSEKEDIVKVLSSLPDVVLSAEPGKHVITLSFQVQNRFSVFSCYETNCPPQVCAIYDLANSVAKRQERDYIQLTCPLK